MTSGNDGALTVNLTLTAAPSAPRMPLVIEKTTTPSQLREKAAAETKIPLDKIRLIFRGRMIQNDDTKEAIAEYKLENDCVLHCMGKPVESAPVAAAATPASSPSTAAAGASVSFLPTAAAASNTSAPAGGDSLQVALNTLRSSNSVSDYLTAVTTLDKILSNCIDKPLEAKYRSVKRQNAAFQRRLGGLQGGHEAILACGFIVQGQGDDESYVLVASPEAWPKLLATKAQVSTKVTEAKSAAGTTSAPPAATAGGGFGGASLPPVGMGAGMPAGMGAGGVPPNMQNAMSNLMADPNALQSMLQDPSVQNMMQNDPRLNNPQMRQAMDSLASNPQMLNQVSSMMRDPAMQAQMQQMMQGGAGMPGMNMPAAGMGGAPPSQAPSNTNASGASQPNNNNNNRGENDDELTEEEMIAEAIRRSLGEN